MTTVPPRIVAAVDHVHGREQIIDELRKEMFGPAPVGRPLRTVGTIRFESREAAYGPWHDETTGEEILDRDSPTIRYGIGVLYPCGAQFDAATLEKDPSLFEGEAKGEEGIEPADDDGDSDAETSAVGAEDDFDLSLANAYRPSSLGISFLAEMRDEAELVVTVTAGRYRRLPVAVADRGNIIEWTWWLRQPVRIEARFPLADLLTRERLGPSSSNVSNENCEDLDLRIEVLSRRHSNDQRLLTVCVVNRTSAGLRETNESAIFQTRLVAAIRTATGLDAILPYPSIARNRDPEEESLDLLYRDAQTYATGHGCSADWRVSELSGRGVEVSAQCLPVVTTRSITPDVKRVDGSVVAVPMSLLADLERSNAGFRALEEVIEHYEKWIVERAREIESLAAQYRSAASRHLALCQSAAARMREGLAYINDNEIARLAFTLANRAMLLQQAARREAPRTIQFDANKQRVSFSEEFVRPDSEQIAEQRGKWRAFQIAFLLMTIKSAAEPTEPDRRTVDLVWFPTGGGKTEAYLALAAFVMFKRRLERKEDAGVSVLMRYTLRLLTTQQFQRACALLCAMEFVRRSHEDRLGAEIFSIGIWLGGDSTPNKRREAIDKLRQMERGNAENPFLLTMCPWCGAQFKPVCVDRKRGRPVYIAPFARRVREAGWDSDTAVLICPDEQCDFHSQLPIFTVDEDIYYFRPTLVIGTLDKFAVLAWVPEAAALFGRAVGGEQLCSPPSLIVQDELHLISGPLGSIAGLYEVVINELCTTRDGIRVVPPKIICSTATTRRYEDQVRALYGRDRVAVFPPPGLEASDSFFARYDDTDAPGRTFVGIHAASLGSVQTEWVRTFTALLQAPMTLPPEARDPWWTLLVFFNSIREMGTAHTLFDSDVRDRSYVLWNRQGASPSERRHIRILEELTGGVRGDEIAASLAKLETSYDRDPSRCQDVCLASSFIEVGIDIQRLSLIVIAGQPKTTSQYIQVTGRIGRMVDRPGLVVTMYSPSKPRDRSHYERFRSYHERLYAQVEPSSVTPFSAPALDRALHAVLVAYARQTDRDAAHAPYPVPDARLQEIFTRLLERVTVVDQKEEANLREVFERRLSEWRRWHRPQWRTSGDEIGLLRPAGEYASAEEAALSWPTPTSMRHVDAACEARITTLYLTEIETSDA